jgi:glucose-6-phosphate 1-epimerase
LRYRDSANGNAEHIETNQAIHFSGEVDRIYIGSSSPVVMKDNQHRVQCSAQGFGDTVIWSPGAALSRKLGDMDDDGYRHMVCIEAAVIAVPVTLAPNHRWQGTQILAASS